MKCDICKKDRADKEQELIISGKRYRFCVCEQCENEKGAEYDAFFDDIRNRVKPEEVD